MSSDVQTIPFDEAVALHSVGDGRFQAMIAPGWDVRGIPHGGYLLALLGAAGCRVATQPDPISVSASYLAPPEFGAAELRVEMLRAGRRQSTVAVGLTQHDLPRAHAVVTVGTIDDVTPKIWAADVEAPSIPSPSDSIDMRAIMAAADEDIRLHQHLELRVHPDTGFIADDPPGTPQLDGWLRLADGRPPDPLALLMFSDGFPPSIFEATGRAVGHVPTVQLTTHLFALPAPGWVQARCRTRVQGGGFVDEDGELWDSDGRLVATTRQLALLRQP